MLALAVAIGGVTLLSGTLAAAAQDASELESQIDSAQEQAAELGAQIEANAAAISQAQAEAETAAAQEAEMTAVLERGVDELETLQEEVAATQVALERARRQLRAATQLLSERLVAIYKGDVPDTTDVILNSEGYDDLATRVEYLEAIQDADEALVLRVRSLREQVQGHLASVESARDRQADFNAQLETARNQIAGVRAAAQARASELASMRAQQVATVETLNSNVEKWTDQVQKIEAASASEATATVTGWMGDYVIPSAIVMCESGGNYGAVNPSSGAGGAYQIMPSTWELYGGEGAPQDASPAEQDAIAAQIWADSGSAAWVCAG